MSVGESVLSLLGRKDPREALLQSVLNAGQGGAQYAAQPAAAPATAAPADGQGGTPPQPQVAQAYQSPPDLAAMYKDLTKYNSAESNINRGFGLIGSSISQDGNREATLNSFTGDRPASDQLGVGNIVELAQSMQKAKLAQMTRAAQLASLPSIATQLGIPIEQVRQAFEGGKLEELIQQQNKPDRTQATNAQGQPQAIDLTTGQPIGAPIGPAKARETRTFTDPSGVNKTVYTDDGTEVPGAVRGSPDMSTADTKNYEKYLDDESIRGTDYSKVLSFNDWALQQNKSKTTPATKTENAFAQQSGTDFAKDYAGIRSQANNAQDLIGQYDLISKALDSGLETGAVANATATARKLAQAMGMEVDTDKITAAELVKSVANRMALTMRNPESGMGMPGSLSDKDITFLKDANVGIDTSVEGNRLLIDAYKRVQERKVEIAKLANQYVKKNGQLDGDFAQYVTDYNAANPIFDDVKVNKEPPKIDDLITKYGTKK